MADFRRRAGAHRLAILPLALLLLAGDCYNRDDFSPTAPEVSSALSLTATPSAVPADGASTVDIVATIRGNPLIRSVDFTTTAGTFLGGDSSGDDDAQTTRAQTDSTGTAKVQLQSSNKVETAIIEASISEQTTSGSTTTTTVLVAATTTVNFVLASADAITLTADATSIPADGFSTVGLLAAIGETDPNRRTVTFSTSAGTIVGGMTDSSGGSSKDVEADSANQARARLQSSTTVGAAVVEARLKDVTGAFDSLTIEFEPVDSADIIQISSSTASAPADGATRTQIFADISPDLPTGSRNVTFTTNAGSFAQAPTNNPRNFVVEGVDSSNRATVDLVSSDAVETARVTASVDIASDETTVSFFAALPESVVVSTDKTAITANGTDKTQVTARLFRSVGGVTDGTVVQYSATRTSDGSTLDLTFQSVTPSKDGVSTADLTAPTGTPAGTATITASVPGSGVSGSVIIQIN